MMPSIMSGSLIRDTPPWARMSAGTRSSAITATAPASSAILACSAVTTSMITPPLSISAMPRLTRAVPVTGAVRSVEAVRLGHGSSLLGRAPGVAAQMLRAGQRHVRQPIRPPVACTVAPITSRWRPLRVSSRRRRPAPRGSGRRCRSSAATRVPAAHPQQPHQRPAARRPGVADQVGVHLPGQRQPAAGRDRPPCSPDPPGPAGTARSCRVRSFSAASRSSGGASSAIRAAAYSSTPKCRSRRAPRRPPPGAADGRPGRRAAELRAACSRSTRPAVQMRYAATSPTTTPRPPPTTCAAS